MRTHIASACLLVTALSPSAALAWTEARVSDVSASLDVTDPARTQVELELSIQVRSGWLSSLELFDLDADLELGAADAVSSTSPEGLRSIPEVVTQAAGSLLLRWNERSSAPKRGQHRVRLVYTTQQLTAAAKPGAHGMQRLQWTLPRWPVRLAGVRVTVVGPAGLRPWLRSEHVNFGEHVERTRNGSSSVLTYTRAELPRTDAWSIGFELPVIALPGRGTATSTPAQTRSKPDAWAGLIGACLGLLVLAKRRLNQSSAAPATIAARASIGVDGPATRSSRCARMRSLARRGLQAATAAWFIDPLAFGLCALSPVLLANQPGLALACGLGGVASALDLRVLKEFAADSGGGSPLRWRAWFGRAAWLDATTPAGALLLGALFVAAAWAPEPVRLPALACSWLAVPLFFTRTRLHARSASNFVRAT